MFNPESNLPPLPELQAAQNAEDLVANPFQHVYAGYLALRTAEELTGMSYGERQEMAEDLVWSAPNVGDDTAYGYDADHRRTTTDTLPMHVKRAIPLLERNIDNYAEEILPNLQHYVNSEFSRMEWGNTSGFATLRLDGSLSAYGQEIRIHTWPRFYRPSESYGTASRGLPLLDAKGQLYYDTNSGLSRTQYDIDPVISGDPHTHKWHVVSKDIIGDFGDRLFSHEAVDAQSIAMDEGKLAANGLSRILTTHYDKGAGSAILVPNGTIVKAISSDSAVRQRRAGEFQVLAAHVSHAPVIPLDRTVVTGVFNGHAQEGFAGPEITIGNDGSAIRSSRPAVTEEEAAYMKLQMYYEARQALGTLSLAQDIYGALSAEERRMADRIKDDADTGHLFSRQMAKDLYLQREQRLGVATDIPDIVAAA